MKKIFCVAIFISLPILSMVFNFSENTIFLASGADPPGLYGFDFSKHSINTWKIHSGGPPKDGIPAILKPKFVTAKEASTFLEDEDAVLGMEIGGEARTYPLKIMNFHEVVNDQIKDEPFAAAW